MNGKKNEKKTTNKKNDETLLWEKFSWKQTWIEKNPPQKLTAKVYWLVVSTRFKTISHIGSSPQVRVNNPQNIFETTNLVYPFSHPWKYEKRLGFFAAYSQVYIATSKIGGSSPGRKLAEIST